MARDVRDGLRLRVGHFASVTFKPTFNESQDQISLIYFKQPLMPNIQKIAPCLWFDSQAEDAAKFYLSIFKNSKITNISRYCEEGKEIHGKEPGTVMTVEFELDGQSFTGLNGGPIFKFTEAISFQIDCATQEELDHFWGKLGAGGDPDAQQLSLIHI